MRLMRIITSATVTNLTTLQAVRLELGAAATSADDLLITAMIGQASAMAAGFANRVFGVEAIEELQDIDPSSCPWLFVDKMPVVDIISCDVEGQPIALPDLETGGHEGTVIMLKDGKMLPAWPAGRTTIRYRAGYVLEGAQRNVPADLERSVIIITKALFHARERDPALRSETVDAVGSWSFQTSGISRAIPQEAALLLSQYRIPSI
jgi:hypothetical protein